MGKKVSIIIPVYNGSNYLKAAIDSALAQDYKNLEIIVVNDGSTDNGATRKIAKEYGNKIVYYEKENGGAASALNYGISKMTGEYMSWLSHDDLYYPNKISRQIEELKKYDDKTILFSNFDLIDKNGNKYDTVCYDHKLLKKIPDYAVLRGCIGGITLLIPKKALDECGDFSLKLRCVQDYDMWFRMLNNYKFVHMEDVLTMTRIHPKQDTQTSPKMKSEGNWLWTYMAENYPKEKKVAIEGSEYLFYKELENYLSGSPYEEAIENIHNMAEKCLEHAKEKMEKGILITVVIIDNNNREDLDKTINSLTKQGYENYNVIIEGKTKNSKYPNTKNRKESIDKVETKYVTFLNAGVKVSNDWLYQQVLRASIIKKSVVISDYNRPLRTGLKDNYCSYLTSIDGVIIKLNKKIKYETPYQYMLEHALEGGSIVQKESYLSNVNVNYDMKEVYDYLRRVLETDKCSDYQIASLNYDISCIYNKYSKGWKKVYMYEPCDEYKELKYSRSFQIFKKYYDYKKKKKKKL